MNHIALLAGMLLPWLTGSVLLFAFRKRLGLGTTTLLGYGFFLGAAILYLVLLGWQTALGTAGFWPVAITLLSLSGMGLLLGRSPAGAEPSAQNKPTSFKNLRPDWLVIGLLALVACHFALIAVELFYRPVFPWDAWQTWMYQAKAWFYSGGPVALDSPEDWIRGSGVNTYNMQGHHYPGLVSAQSHWAAVAFGEWSETRVNWPMFFCGLALSLALWGQTRAAGASPRITAATCFILISVPLVGTHLSLAGYADLWLAGFSGLGIIAVLRALLEAHSGQLLLGFGFLVLGLLAKHDAMVWLACGIALYCLVRHLRTSLLIAGICVIFAGGLAVADITVINAPGAGQFGIAKGQLLLGPLGSWLIEPNNVAPAYFKHLYTLGSWNILWYLVLVLTFILITSKRLGALRPAMAWFFVLLVVSQASIFGLSAASAWANDGTAANRLLLQVTPVVVFLLGMTVARLQTRGGDVICSKSLWRPTLASALSAVLVGASAHFWIYEQAENAQSASRNFNGKEFRAVMGSASLVDGEAQITDYENGAAILSTGRTYLNADDLKLVEMHTNPDNRKHRTFFWRRAEDPQSLPTLSVPATETTIDLRNEPNWEGKISEVGLMFRNDHGHTTGLSRLTLQTITTASLWNLATQQWFQSERWSQRSAHGLRGGADEPLLPLPLLLGGWLLLSLLILAIMNGKRGQRITPIATLALLAWLVLEVRWLHNSWGQALATFDHYRHTAHPDALDIGEDAAIVAMAQAVAQRLGEEPARVAIGMATDVMRFDMRRAKYAMLPHAGHVHDGELGSLQTEYAEAVLIIHPEGRPIQALPKKFKGRDGLLYPAVRFRMGTLYVLPNNNAA